MRHRMRFLLAALPLVLCFATTAPAQVSIQVRLPGVDIGVNMPTYPQLVLVPGTPVYYDSHANSNYFFYDGMYWVYARDTWYASTWYDGPWDRVDPDDMPLYVLRVPVRYYRQPPTYFSGWRTDAAPRWDEHWGHDWHNRRDGWDQWDRHSGPKAAPLPVYQREYAGKVYPNAADQQGSIRTKHYRYKPREAVTRRHYEATREQSRQEGSSRGNNGHHDRNPKDGHGRK